MKRTNKIFSALILAAIASVSACKAGETAKQAPVSAETSHVTTHVMVQSPETNPEPYAGISAAVSLETTELVSSGAVEAETEFSQETVELDIEKLEPNYLDENFGEYKDDSNWNRMLDKDSAKNVNKVFLISVDAGTTDAMMNEVNKKYSLTVVYDYENFNMYAVAVPEALDKQQSDDFISELIENYDFILSVEPDSHVFLDNKYSSAPLIIQ